MSGTKFSRSFREVFVKFSRSFAKFSQVFPTFRQLASGTCLDLFGPAPMCSDPFGSVRKVAFVPHTAPKISEMCFSRFEGPGKQAGERFAQVLPALARSRLLGAYDFEALGIVSRSTNHLLTNWSTCV